MAGTFISIEIDDTKIRAALERLQQATGDVAPALADIGELLLKRHRVGGRGKCRRMAFHGLP